MGKSHRGCQCANDNNCKKEIDTARTFVNKLPRKRNIYAVAHFDLKDSTKKIRKKPYKTITEMLLHNKMCRNIIEQNKGQVIKELGDAVMVRFKNSGMACECAIKVIRNLKKYGKGICTKVTVASGTIWDIKTHIEDDAYGVPVNLCSRMSKHTKLDCILFEEDSHTAISNWLHDDKRIKYYKVKDKGKDVDLLSFGFFPMRMIKVN